MSSLTFTTLLASVMALLASIGASCVAVHLWRRYPSTSAGKLSQRLTDLTELVEMQALAIRQLRSRVNMQKARAEARLAEEETPPAQDAAQVRRELGRTLNPNPFRRP